MDGLGIFRPKMKYDGSVVLIFHRTGRIVSGLSGQQTAFTDFVYSGDIDFVSIVFQPTGAMNIFEMPVSELTNRNVTVDILNDPQIWELDDRLRETADTGECVLLIENFLRKRIYQSEILYDKRLTSVIESIGYGQCDMSGLARTACLGYRLFRRVFSACIGISYLIQIGDDGC